MAQQSPDCWLTVGGGELFFTITLGSTFKSDKEAIMKEEREEKLSDQHGKISFFCGNPMVEIIKGIIHIYKNK